MFCLLDNIIVFGSCMVKAAIVESKYRYRYTIYIQQVTNSRLRKQRPELALWDRSKIPLFRIVCLFSWPWRSLERKVDFVSEWKKEAPGIHLRGREAGSLIGCFCGEGFELIPGDA